MKLRNLIFLLTTVATTFLSPSVNAAPIAAPEAISTTATYGLERRSATPEPFDVLKCLFHKKCWPEKGGLKLSLVVDKGGDKPDGVKHEKDSRGEPGALGMKPTEQDEDEDTRDEDEDAEEEEEEEEQEQQEEDVMQEPSQLGVEPVERADEDGDGVEGEERAGGAALQKKQDMGVGEQPVVGPDGEGDHLPLSELRMLP